MPFLMGQYVRITDVGLDSVVEASRASQVIEFDSYRAQTNMLLQALSHFSLAASGAQLLLVDTCLVDHRLVTGIHLHKLVSRSNKQSVERMMHFMQTHECNNMCRKLCLPPVNKLMQSNCLDLFGTDMKGSQPSRRGHGPALYRSPRGGAKTYGDTDLSMTDRSRVLSSPGTYCFDRVEPSSTLRPVTAAILDHPQPDWDDVLASAPWSQFSSTVRYWTPHTYVMRTAEQELFIQKWRFADWDLNADAEDDPLISRGRDSVSNVSGNGPTMASSAMAEVDEPPSQPPQPESQTAPQSGRHVRMASPGPPSEVGMAYQSSLSTTIPGDLAKGEGNRTTRQRQRGPSLHEFIHQSGFRSPSPRTLEQLQTETACQERAEARRSVFCQIYQHAHTCDDTRAWSPFLYVELTSFGCTNAYRVHYLTQPSSVPPRDISKTPILRHMETREGIGLSANCAGMTSIRNPSAEEPDMLAMKRVRMRMPRYLKTAFRGKEDAESGSSPQSLPMLSPSRPAQTACNFRGFSYCGGGQFDFNQRDELIKGVYFRESKYPMPRQTKLISKNAGAKSKVLVCLSVGMKMPENHFCAKNAIGCRLSVRVLCFT